MKNYLRDITNIMLILSLILIIPSCKKEVETITVNDIDGNIYKTVLIGDNYWMAENLKTTKFNNGDAIPNITDVSEWIESSIGARCYYNNDSTTYSKEYGALYNWFAVVDSRKLCPTGWHVPTDTEWKQLEMDLGMNQSDADKIEWRGTNEGGELKETGINHWDSPNTGAENNSGFTALPGGYRGSGYFNNVGYYGLWWSATESVYDVTYAWRRTLSCVDAGIYRYYSPKTTGISVRCGKD